MHVCTIYRKTKNIGDIFRNLPRNRPESYLGQNYRTSEIF